MEFNLKHIKEVQCNTPILDWLLSKYETADDIPVISTHFQGKYEQGYCQVFRTIKKEISPAEKDETIKIMIKEQKIDIENALKYNELSGMYEPNPHCEPITWLPSLTELAMKVIPKTFHFRITLLGRKPDNLEFGLGRMANDQRGNRAFRLETIEYKKWNGETVLDITLLSDIGLTCKTKEAELAYS